MVLPPIIITKIRKKSKLKQKNKQLNESNRFTLKYFLKEKKN